MMTMRGARRKRGGLAEPVAAAPQPEVGPAAVGCAPAPPMLDLASLLTVAGLPVRFDLHDHGSQIFMAEFV